MAATTAQKTTVLNVLSQMDAYLTDLQGDLHTAVSGLSGSSTSAQLDTAVDTYNTLRNAAYTTYGGVQLPPLDVNDALSAVATEAHA